MSRHANKSTHTLAAYVKDIAAYAKDIDFLFLAWIEECPTFIASFVVHEALSFASFE